MNIRPLHDRLIVKREAEERKSPGGIVIPDTAIVDNMLPEEVYQPVKDWLAETAVRASDGPRESVPVRSIDATDSGSARWRGGAVARRRLNAPTGGRQASRRPPPADRRPRPAGRGTHGRLTQA